MPWSVKEKCQPREWEECIDKTKPYNIAKWTVMDAWKRVKAKGGGPGIDDQTIEVFGENLKDNLYSSCSKKRVMGQGGASEDMFLPRGR